MLWVERVVGGTRGQILGLLCQGPRTVSEVSNSLGLTPNGVRGHLAALEADGMVKLIGAKKRVGKPAHVFELTPAGQSLLSTAYRPVLHCVLDAMRDHDPDGLEEIVRIAGQRLAALYPKATGDSRLRAESGARILRELGSAAQVEVERNALVIRAVCCPLGDAVPDHPKVCKLIEAMLADLLGQPIEEFCHKTPPLQCQFRLLPTEGTAEKKKRLSSRR